MYSRVAEVLEILNRKYVRKALGGGTVDKIVSVLEDLAREVESLRSEVEVLRVRAVASSEYEDKWRSCVNNLIMLNERYEELRKRVRKAKSALRRLLYDFDIRQEEVKQYISDVLDILSGRDSSGYEVEESDEEE